MADLKISEFANGGAIQATDEIATNRAGANTKVFVGTMAAEDASDYQALLVSGTNIKTINSTSILGSGNIAISGGGETGVAEILRNNKVACAGTSYLGDKNSLYSQLVTKYGDYFQGCLNGANSGQNVLNIANHFYTNVISQKPAFVILSIASNDMDGGTTTDPAAYGSGSIANCKYFLPLLVKQARANGIKVIVTSEPYRQGGASNVNRLYWNNTFAPDFVTSLADDGVIFVDTAAEIASSITGDALIAPIITTGSGTSGASTFTVGSATGITTGMHPWSSLGVFNPNALPTRVTGISGTTITFSGTLSGTLSGNVYFFTDYSDEIHSSPLGAGKQAVVVYDAMVAAGWVNTYAPLKAFTSSTAANSVDNLISNGTLLGSVTSGVGDGWATNYSGTKTVDVDADFLGKAQLVTVVAGDAGGSFLLCPEADVVRMRGRRVAACIRVKTTGFQEAGAIYSVRGNFDKTPPALPATFNSEASPPVWFENISFNGEMVFYGEAIVPATASTFRFNITINAAFPAGATSATIKAGEAILIDMEHPQFDASVQFGSKYYESFLTPAITAFDNYLKIDTGASGKSVALPSASSWAGKIIVIEKGDSGAGTLTVTGATKGSVVLSSQYSTAIFFSDESSIRVWSQI